MSRLICDFIRCKNYCFNSDQRVHRIFTREVTTCYMTFNCPDNTTLGPFEDCFKYRFWRFPKERDGKSPAHYKWQNNNFKPRYFFILRGNSIQFPGNERLTMISVKCMQLISLLEYLACLFIPQHQVEMAHRYFNYLGEFRHPLFYIKIPFL